MLRGGNLPLAYVYPSEMRATRDLLRRRMRFVRKRGGLYSHIQNTITQYNLPPYEERIDQARNRAGLLEHFEDEDVRMSVAANMALLDTYDETIDELELFLESRAKVHDASTFYLLRTIPGIGKVLALTILYEIHEISRFPGVGNFLSYGRLHRPPLGGREEVPPATCARWYTTKFIIFWRWYVRIPTSAVGMPRGGSRTCRCAS